MCKAKYEMGSSSPKVITSKSTTLYDTLKIKYFFCDELNKLLSVSPIACPNLHKVKYGMNSSFHFMFKEVYCHKTTEYKIRVEPDENYQIYDQKPEVSVIRLNRFEEPFDDEVFFVTPKALTEWLERTFKREISH